MYLVALAKLSWEAVKGILWEFVNFPQTQMNYHFDVYVSSMKEVRGSFASQR